MKRVPIEGTTLTKREQEVMRYVCKGFTFRQSAELLGLKPRTIDSHLSRIKARLGAANLAEAVFRLGRDGFEA